jgi:hypothetical protein
METIDIAIETIIRLRKQINFEEYCLAKALQSIPDKYAKILLSKYVDLCSGANNG